MQRFAQFFSRRRRYDDISVSIQEHMEDRIEELMDDGISRKQAEQRARREFGNVALLEQRSREVWQWPALESIVADLRVAAHCGRCSSGFRLPSLRRFGSARIS